MQICKNILRRYEELLEQGRREQEEVVQKRQDEIITLQQTVASLLSSISSISSSTPSSSSLWPRERMRSLSPTNRIIKCEAKSLRSTSYHHHQCNHLDLDHQNKKKGAKSTVCLQRVKEQQGGGCLVQHLQHWAAGENFCLCLFLQAAGKDFCLVFANVIVFAFFFCLFMQVFWS